MVIELVAGLLIGFGIGYGLDTFWDHADVSGAVHIRGLAAGVKTMLRSATRSAGTEGGAGREQGETDVADEAQGERRSGVPSDGPVHRQAAVRRGRGPVVHPHQRDAVDGDGGAVHLALRAGHAGPRIVPAGCSRSPNWPTASSTRWSRMTGQDGVKYFPYDLHAVPVHLHGQLSGLIPMSFSPTSHIAVTAVLGFGVFIAVTVSGLCQERRRISWACSGCRMRRCSCARSSR
jgi:hypothetical protein